ncbi:MAG: hypothetical protein CL422_12485 [Acidimicrobiaceae bacterium]|nr:hypothetical protein [Acidimicrobiaceae bacterium]
MVSYPVRRDVSDSMIDGFDAQRSGLAELLYCWGRVNHVVLGHDPRVVDLQQEPGVDDGSVLLPHGLGDAV